MYGGKEPKGGVQNMVANNNPTSQGKFQTAHSEQYINLVEDKMVNNPSVKVRTKHSTKDYEKSSLFNPILVIFCQTNMYNM